VARDEQREEQQRDAGEEGDNEGDLYSTRSGHTPQ
jgi:hypothetical protein